MRYLALLLLSVSSLFPISPPNPLLLNAYSASVPFEAEQGRSRARKEIICGGASTPVFLDLLIMVNRCLIAGETLQRGFPRRCNRIKIAV